MKALKVAGLTVACSLALAATAYAGSSPYAPPDGVTVKVTQRGDGWVFADAKGMTLYTYEVDAGKPGLSTCTGPCAEQWPPLLAADDAKPHGAWSVIVRDDGKKQWAVSGKPLYAFAEEGGPGTAFGDGDGSQWHEAFEPIWTPPGITIGKTLLGNVLANADGGTTLYTRESDPANVSKCSGSCLDDFAPVSAPALANANGDWTVVTRNDRTKQWAYKGKPLYRCLLDVKAGDTKGDGAGTDEGWRATVLEPAPKPPSWVRVQASLAGELLADAQGMTLYYHGGPRRTLMNLTAGQLATNKRLAAARARQAPPSCDTSPDCMGPDWKGVLADVNAKDVGEWTIMSNKDGTRQWAYKGRRLYTSTADTRPGEFKGVRFGGDRSWLTIMRDGRKINNG